MFHTVKTGPYIEWNELPESVKEFYLADGLEYRIKSIRRWSWPKDLIKIEVDDSIHKWKRMLRYQGDRSGYWKKVS